MARGLLWTSVAFASQAAAACTRASLQEVTAAYLQAQAAGKPSLLPLASNVTYLENDATTDIAKGLLTQAITIDFNRSLYDTEACATFTEITAATNKHPYVIDTKFLLTGGKITHVESVIADDGDWLFNAKNHLTYTSKESWEPIPAAQRDTRAVIQAAGDAYLNSWGDGKVPVPYGTPCARLEGGIYTGDKTPTTNTCKMPEFPQPFKIVKRNYVVDEEGGGVAIFNEFPFIDKTKPNGTASVNYVRVEGGKIRYIHETTICATKNCGR